MIKSAADLDQFRDGDVLVTDKTDPDWEPIMKKAAAIVTDRGGRTCHAAIVSRELGLPAIVGTGTRTEMLQGRPGGHRLLRRGRRGLRLRGPAPIRATRDRPRRTVPATRTKIMMNLGNPEEAFRWWRLPTDGVGLARMEFIITTTSRSIRWPCSISTALKDADAKARDRPR